MYYKVNIYMVFDYKEILAVQVIFKSMEYNLSLNLRGVRVLVYKKQTQILDCIAFPVQITPSIVGRFFHNFC